MGSGPHFIQTINCRATIRHYRFHILLGRSGETKYGKLSATGLEPVMNDGDCFSTGIVRRGVGEVRQDLPHLGRPPA
jgi:hypothetical protein